MVFEYLEQIETIEDGVRANYERDLDPLEHYEQVEAELKEIDRAMLGLEELFAHERARMAPLKAFLDERKSSRSHVTKGKGRKEAKAGGTRRGKVAKEEGDEEPETKTKVQHTD